MTSVSWSAHGEWVPTIGVFANRSAETAITETMIARVARRYARRGPLMVLEKTSIPRPAPPPRTRPRGSPSEPPPPSDEPSKRSNEDQEAFERRQAKWGAELKA